jgi:nucleotide-binding universal stress UspA family protein
VKGILVAIDGSETSLRALRHAMTLGAPIHLVNVQPKADAPVLLLHRTPEEIKRHQRDYGATRLDSAKHILETAAVPYQAHVCVGEPAEQIVQVCTEHDLGAIVMGTRGMTAIGNLVLGSTATKVIHLTRVPVALVK